jgi:DNA-binding winged helix-turn-helix (wHTH) protein/tetratricopeptide (TPR) repeat protein
MHIEIGSVYRFGSFEVNPSERAVTDGGKPVAIPSRAFDVLLYMVRNPRRLLTKEELLNAVWSDAAVEEGNLSQSVFLLRKAFNGNSRPEPLIVTVPGRGYQFAAAVEEISTAVEVPATAEQIPMEQGPLVDLASRATPPARHGRWLLLGLGIAAAAVGAFSVSHYPLAAPPLSGQRQLVLADFENRTGEMAFDHSLRKALEIDLQQSPFFTVLPEADSRQTLKLMEHSPDDALTAPLAREVCERNNSQAVLSGLIARFGGKYLITLDATDCAAGKSLVQSKTEAASRDDVLRALDRIAADMRGRLGESMASIRQFDAPLFPERTGSLDALRSYSEGVALVNQGKLHEAIPFLDHAIELDSDFAVARLSLSSVYYTLGERDLEIPNIAKAWALRDTVGERQRLAITARYHQSVTGDLDEAVRNYQQWTRTYPLDPAPWSSLANAESVIAQYPAAIDAAKHSLALNPKVAVVYVILARAYIRSSQYGNADTICRQAIAAGLDGADIHGLMLDTAFIRKDTAGVEAEMKWAQGKPAESLMLLRAAMIALSQGKARLGLDLFSQTAELYRKQGLKERGNLVLAASTRLLFDMGLIAEARELVDRLPPIDGQTDLIVAAAELGDTARASGILDHDLAEFPSDTLWQKVRGPQIRAALLLQGHKPLEAINELRSGVPYDLRTFDLNTLRGRAYLEAGKGQEAVAEYRKILDHQGVDPLSPDYPLAWLGAARGYALSKNIPESRDAYEHFFGVWKDADADVPALQQAKLEYAKVSEAPAQP